MLQKTWKSPPQPTPAYKLLALNGKDGLHQHQEQIEQCLENGIKPSINTEPDFPMPLIEFCNTTCFTLDPSKLPYGIDLSVEVNSITWPTSMLLPDDLFKIISNSKVKLTQTNKHKRLCKALSGTTLHC